MLSSKTRLSPQAGFTLLEVLIALAIFAVCAMVLTMQSSNTLSNQQRLIDQQIALWVAKDSLVEQRIEGVAHTDRMIEVSKQKTQAGRLWAVVLTIEPTTDPQLSKLTVNVKANVTVSAGGRPDAAIQLISFLK